jgi:hypothetical protein
MLVHVVSDIRDELGLAEGAWQGLSPPRSSNSGEHLDGEEGAVFSPRIASRRGIRSFSVLKMAQLGRYRFLAIAVVFHLIYIYRSAIVTAGAIASANDGSIFSIYFVSPIVHGMREHRVENQEAPAKRLVLFVGPSRSSGGSFKN